MKVIPFIKAIFIGIVVYVLLYSIGLGINNPIWLQSLYGKEILDNTTISASFENLGAFFHSGLYGLIAIGTGLLAYLFDWRFKGRVRWLKTIVSLLFIIVVSVQGLNFYCAADQFLGDLENYQPTMEEQLPIIEQSGPNIIVRADEEYYEQHITQIQQAIAMMPEFLLENCKTIYILDSEHYEQEGKFLEMENPLDTAGFSYSGDMAVRIRIIDEPYILNTYTHTVAHELCHIYDFSKGDVFKDPSGLSTTKEFKELYKQAPDSIGEYASSNEYEFFAEAGCLYITDPDTLNQYNSDLYQYFDRLFGPMMNNE